MTIWPWSRDIRFNYFKTVRGVLDAAVKAYTEEKGATVERVKSEMNKHLECFSVQYYTGKKPVNEYKKPLCRLAYLYCYVPANANLCEIALRSKGLLDFILNRLNDEEEIKVCSFGGGPGTELLALTKLLVGKRKSFPKSTITFTLLDEVEEWAESWGLIEREIRSFMKEKFGKTSSWPFIISNSFVPFDMTDIGGYGNIKHLFGQDLYILCYVLSEIFEDEAIEGLKKLLSAMATTAKPGSKFLVIDRNESSMAEKAVYLLKELGIDVSEIEESSTSMDVDEESSDLGMHFSDRKPRLTWNSFWIVGSKT